MFRWDHLLRRSDSDSALVGIARGIVGPLLAEPFAKAARNPVQVDGQKLEKDGYFIARGLLGPEVVEEGQRIVRSLVTAELPGVFAFLFDPLWSLAKTIHQTLLTVHPDYGLLDDEWAWAIKAGESGWPPHRGGGLEPFDRLAPELLTVWVALSDVAADQACVHIVPLDDDPHYPERLDSVIPPTGKAVPLSAKAGDLLIWNANALHWGGSCSSQHREGRVSCSFSFGRPSSRLDKLDVSFLPDPMNDSSRLDSVIRQIAIYGENQRDVAPEVLDWARMALALRHR